MDVTILGAGMKNIWVRRKQTSIDKSELYIEFGIHFIFLPLFGETPGSYNQNPLQQTSHHQFFNKSPVMMVLPAPVSSASKNRILGNGRRNLYTAST